MILDIVVESSEYALISLAGRLDLTGVNDIDEKFNRATSADRSAVVDLSRVDFITSLGIGLLFGSAQTLRAKGHKLVVLSPQLVVEKTLKAAHMELVIPIASSLEQATAIIGVGRGQSPLAPDTSFNARIQNSVFEFERLNPSIAAYLDLHVVQPSVAYAVHLVIEEMVLNVIKHAYLEPGDHLIDLKLSIEEGRVRLEVEDDGIPFDPTTVPAPKVSAYLDNRRTGGLGIHLVRTMSESMDYERVNDRNRVTICISPKGASDT